uniref:Uncharacterized protein n=1 Tax=Leersia perrieri TaxID=77586 RepID=A0A0D9VIV9_9ORYZ
MLLLIDRRSQRPIYQHREEVGRLRKVAHEEKETEEGAKPPRKDLPNQVRTSKSKGRWLRRDRRSPSSSSSSSSSRWPPTPRRRRARRRPSCRTPSTPTASPSSLKPTARTLCVLSVYLEISRRVLILLNSISERMVEKFKVFF